MMRFFMRILITINLSVVAAFASDARANESEIYEKLLSEAGPAFVTVKYVLKMQGQFGNRETEAEISGVMIDPSGLVLCGNTRLGSPRLMRSIGGTATPTDIKVLVGDDTEGLEARVLARDSELDLAWVAIKKPGDKKFACLDFSRSTTPKLGEPLISLRRMAKYFDRAYTVNEGRLAGRTTKPRELLIPGGAMVLEPGLPVFTSGGKLVGVVVVQMPEDDELQSMAFSGIGRDISNGLILPASEVIKATQRAKEAKSEDSEGDEAEEGSGEKSTGKKRDKAESSTDKEDHDPDESDEESE